MYSFSGEYLFFHGGLGHEALTTFARLGKEFVADNHLCNIYC